MSPTILSLYKCEEKTKAIQDYQQAISRGDGAYLLNKQELNNLFQVNIGNLLPNDKCIIKITYIDELKIENNNICFKLPNSLSVWQTLIQQEEKQQNFLQTKYLNNNNYKTSPTQLIQNKSTSFKASCIMPFKINTIKSLTHSNSLKVKKTDCQAVLEIINLTECNLIEIIINIETINCPRMFVEDYYDEEEDEEKTNEISRACMITFYPEFDTIPILNANICFLIDCSNSMLNRVKLTQKLLTLMLDNLPKKFQFNIILFGTDYIELFPFFQKNSNENIKQAIEFISTNKLKNKGNTDLLNVLEPFIELQNADSNMVLISDGHLNRQNELISILKFQIKFRIFSCSLGSDLGSNNDHLLKIISNLTSSNYDSFDLKNQFNWKDKIINLFNKIKQPNSLQDIQIEWQNQQKITDNNDFNYLYAPIHSNALFTGCRLVYYGFMPNCNQATFKANINGYEFSTLITCSELSITKGNFNYLY